MTLRRAALAAAAALLALLARPLAAQEIHVSGDDRSPAAQLAREILARGNYLRFDRDTVLPATFHAPGDVVIYDADVRLEGQIDGSVAVIGGELFIRPRAVIRGDIANLGGGVYTSALATTGRIVETGPGTQVAIAGDTAVEDTSAYAARIISPARPPVLGFSLRPLPTYDRVNGVTLTLPLRILLARNDSGPRIDAWAAFRFHNPDRPGGGVRVTVPLGFQNVRASVEASRATRTNDAWQRGDLSNSFSVLFTGRDYRDYWDADVLRAMVFRPVGKPLVAGESWLGPIAGVQWSNDRSLRAKNVWSLSNSLDADRPNPPVLEGHILSAFAGAQVTMIGRLSQLQADAQVERAIPGSSDADFTQLLGEATYTATAFRTHTLKVYLRGLTPLGGDAPPQRYQILGGPATIPTLAVAQYR
ncbi:MAG TPA: polymer-forming cytoskeletal protein, partial [Longimicrobiaceae bacterium]